MLSRRPSAAPAAPAAPAAASSVASAGLVVAAAGAGAGAGAGVDARAGAMITLAISGYAWLRMCATKSTSGVRWSTDAGTCCMDSSSISLAVHARAKAASNKTQ